MVGTSGRPSSPRPAPKLPSLTPPPAYGIPPLVGAAAPPVEETGRDGDIGETARALREGHVEREGQPERPARAQVELQGGGDADPPGAAAGREHLDGTDSHQVDVDSLTERARLGQRCRRARFARWRRRCRRCRPRRRRGDRGRSLDGDHRGRLPLLRDGGWRSWFGDGRSRVSRKCDDQRRLDQPLDQLAPHRFSDAIAAIDVARDGHLVNKTPSRSPSRQPRRRRPHRPIASRERGGRSHRAGGAGA